MPTRSQQIKLAIVDDHKLFRKGLITLISMAYKNNYLMLFEAGSGKEMLLKLDKKALPDIILMDIDMPDMDGFETVAWLQQHYPQIAILVVSMIEKEEAIVRMLKLGVKGYLSKDIEVDDIYEAIKAIMDKGYYYTDFITGKLIESIKNEDYVQDPGDDTRTNPVWNQMNENERKFLKLACSELTYQEIADQMFLSPKTIDGYRDALFSRFNIKNRVGLALFAIRNKFVNLE